MQNAPLKPPAAARNKPSDDAGKDQGTSQSLGSQTPPDAPPAPEPPPVNRLDAVQATLPPVAPYQPEPTQRLTPPEPPRAEAADPTLNVPAHFMYVLDTSAHEVERVHEQIISGSIRKFPFKPRTPTPLPPDVAVKFLKSEGFILTDSDGTPKEWAQTPRQPHEMGAGEQISLGPTEVIASLDELNRGSLCKRALQLGASEAALDAPKEDLIAFIKQKTQEFRRQKRNGGRGVSEDVGADLDLEEFLPSADMLPDTVADRYML